MSLVRHVNRLQRPVLCLQQNRQSQIQSQAWRDSLNHLEGRQGWPPSSLRVHFHVAPRFRNFRGSTRVSTWGKGSRSFRHARWRTTKPPTPLPIPRPIMSQRRVVLTQAVGDFCPLIPFRLLVVDDVVVWIVLSAFFASPPFLLFSFFLPSTFNGQSRHDQPSPRSWFFVLLFLVEQTRGRRDCFHGGRQTNVSNDGLPLSIDGWNGVSRSMDASVYDSGTYKIVQESGFLLGVSSQRDVKRYLLFRKVIRLNLRDLQF